MCSKGSSPISEPLSFNSLNQSTLPSYGSSEKKKRPNYICMLQELMLAVGPTETSLLADDQFGMERVAMERLFSQHRFSGETMPLWTWRVHRCALSSIPKLPFCLFIRNMAAVVLTKVGRMNEFNLIFSLLAGTTKNNQEGESWHHFIDAVCYRDWCLT